MKNINLTNFEIDLADIWNYACESYSTGEINASAYKELYYYLGPLYLEQDLKPFLSPETVASGTHKQHYYDSYYYDRSQQIDRGYVVYTFHWHGSFYNILTPCPIKRKNITPLSYQRLFSLKLSQYRHGLVYLKDFLSYHLLKTFNDNQKEYDEFLRQTLVQWQNVLEKSVINEVNILISSGDPLPKWKDPIKDTNENYLAGLRLNPMRENSDVSENTETGPESSPNMIPEDIDSEIKQISEPKTNPDQTISTIVKKDFNSPIPEDYQIIEGKFTRKETFEFFSFLFKEKSVNDKPFLDEAAVAEIFQYGISIPPPGSNIKLHKLNISKSYPKSIIEYAMHRFYIIHTEGGLYNKAQVLPFLCFYFEDFAYGLESDQRSRNFISNITGVKPANMKFDINLYIPERILKSETPKHLLSK